MGVNLQTSAVTYMTWLAPATLTGTSISLMATVTWVLGKGCGSLLAGFLNSMFGTRLMLQMVGGGLLCTTSTYWLIYHMLLKR